MNIKTKLYSSIFLFTYCCTAFGQIFHQENFAPYSEVSELVSLKGETYYYIHIPNISYLEKAGFPELPVKYLKFVVPVNAENVNIVVNNVEKKEYSLDYKIKPFLEYKSIEDTKRTSIQKSDTNLYNSIIQFPANMLEIAEENIFRGIRRITVAIHPCLYYPELNEIEYVENLSFTLNYVLADSNTKKPVNFKGNTNLISSFKRTIENPDDLEKYYSFKGLIHTIPSKSLPANAKNPIKSGISTDCDYLVITSEELAPDFDRFMAWKRRKGVDIDLVTIDYIKQEYQGGDLISGIKDEPGSLRQFLSDAYDEGDGVDYVLLGGDNNTVPIRRGYRLNGDTATNEADIVPTDLYFSEFDGDWDSEDPPDGYYGEPGDAVDYDADIYIGRIMVTNTEEIQNWTNKVIKYEKDPGNGNGSYLTKAFFTQADKMQYYDNANDVLDLATWITEDTVFDEAGGDCTVAVPYFPQGGDVMDEFNNHYGFCSFLAHGAPTKIAVASCYNTSTDCSGNEITPANNSWYLVTSTDATAEGSAGISESGNGFDNMTNSDYPSIYYSISCSTMPFDDYSTPANERNMGEVYTCISNGGGPAYLGNTRTVNRGTIVGLFKDFVDYISDGPPFNIGMVEVMSRNDVGAGGKREKYAHNLLGCPETEIWTDTPNEFSSAYVSEYMTSVTVNTGGVAGSTICLISALDNGSSYRDVRTNVSSASFSNVTMPYNVTITKHNYLPYIKNPNSLYIQNETLSGDHYIYGNYFYAGSNVTTSKPQGPVEISNGANVVFDAENEVYIDGDFEVELGARFAIY